MKHCLERQGYNKMKGRGCFHSIVTALEFLIRLSVAFCFFHSCDEKNMHFFVLIKGLSSSHSIRQLLYKGSGIKVDTDGAAGKGENVKEAVKEGERGWRGYNGTCSHKYIYDLTVLFSD